LTSVGNNKVEGWLNKSPVPTPTRSEVVLESESVLQNLVDPNDSASNIVNVASKVSSNIDVTAVVNNAVVDYSQYTFIGDVLVENATNQAYIQSVNATFAMLAG
jgi:hypothetical protein